MATTEVQQEKPRDRRAGDLLRELRESHGWSPEQVPHELLSRRLPTVSGKTVRRIEDLGVIPTARVKFALAGLYDREPKDIWQRPRIQAFVA